MWFKKALSFGVKVVKVVMYKVNVRQTPFWGVEIVLSFKKYKKDQTHEEELKLKGLITACRQIDKSSFPSIKKYVFKEK